MKTLLGSYQSSVEIIYPTLFVIHSLVEVGMSLLVITHFEITLPCIPVVLRKLFWVGLGFSFNKIDSQNEIVNSFRIFTNSHQGSSSHAENFRVF